MNKLYCEIIKISGKYKKKYIYKYYEVKSPIHGKVYTESCIRRYSSNTVVYKVETFSIEKLRKFPFETYMNLNGKDKAGKKIIEKYSEKVIVLSSEFLLLQLVIPVVFFFFFFFHTTDFYYYPTNFGYFNF